MNTWKVGDFGITAYATSRRVVPSNLARGTPCYRAPELLTDTPQYTQRSDIWGLGCILFEHASERAPFTSDWHVQSVKTNGLPHPDVTSWPDPLKYHLTALLSELLNVEWDRRPRAVEAERLFQAYSLIMVDPIQDYMEYIPAFVSWKQMVERTSGEEMYAWWAEELAKRGFRRPAFELHNISMRRHHERKLKCATLGGILCAPYCQHPSACTGPTFNVVILGDLEIRGLKRHCDGAMDGSSCRQRPQRPAVRTRVSETFPISVECIYLSVDRGYLIGKILVKNLAYEKTVVIRYTTDYWKSASENTALYDDDRSGLEKDWDRFTFSVDLEPILPVIKVNHMIFCVRYQVAGEVYWDNNDGEDYAIRFGY